MKFRTTIASLCLLGVLSASAQDGGNYYNRSSKTSVPVIDRTTVGGSEKTLYLMGEEGGNLLFSGTAQGRVQIEKPKNTEGLLLQVLYPDDTYEAIRQINDGKFEEGIATLRPIAYPLIPYLSLPAGSMNIDPVAERFVYALVNAPGYEREANQAIRHIPLTKVAPAYTMHALTLVTRLVEIGQSDAALQLLNRIPMSKDSEAMLELVMSFADKMREEGNLDEALFLYDRIQQAKGTEAATLAALWSAYCNVALDRIQMASLFVEKAGSFKPEERPYSLARLVEAKIALKNGSYEGCMKEAAEGVVAADVGYNWTPELTYTVASCYENMAQPATAREVYREIILFYPESDWAVKAREALQHLPAPTPAKDEPEA